MVYIIFVSNADPYPEDYMEKAVAAALDADTAQKYCDPDLYRGQVTFPVFDCFIRVVPLLEKEKK